MIPPPRALRLRRGIVLAFLAALTSCLPVERKGGSPVPSGGASSGSGRAPVVLIVMENHEYSSIVGSATAPFLNTTLIPAGRLFTHYTAVAHPSLPNYLAMTSGSIQGKIGTDSVSAGELQGPADGEADDGRGGRRRALHHSRRSTAARCEPVPTTPGAIGADTRDASVRTVRGGIAEITRGTQSGRYGFGTSQ